MIDLFRLCAVTQRTQNFDEEKTELNTQRNLCFEKKSCTKQLSFFFVLYECFVLLDNKQVH